MSSIACKMWILIYTLLAAGCFAVSIERDALKKIYSLSSGKVCSAIPYKMPIEKPGCKKITIDNNFCAGGCNSSYVTYFNETPPLMIFLACKPDEKHTRKKEISLECEENKNGMNFKKITSISVSIIEKCVCGTWK